MSIEVEPSETLYFPSPSEQKVVHDVLIFNSNYHEFASFSIKNPAPDILIISPCSAVLYPKTSVKIEITMLPNFMYHQDVTSSEFIVIEFKTATDPHVLSGRTTGTKTTKKTHHLKFEFAYPPALDSLDVEKHVGWVHIIPTKGFKHSRDDDLKKISIMYGCDVATPLRLDEIYYDPHSHKFVKRSDLKEEIQSFLCPDCLFEVSSKEAHQNRGLCMYCYECPVCCSKLVVILDENEVFFKCNFCQWDSISLGLIERSMKSLFDLVKEKELISSQEMDQKIYRYRENLSKLNLEIDRSRKIARDLNISMAPWKSRIKLEPFDISKLEKQNAEKATQYAVHAPPNTISIKDFIAEDDVETKYYSNPQYEYATIASFEQRLNRPEMNHFHTLDMYPFRKKLITKRLKRYGDRLMVRRENKKDSITFDINTNAIKYIPRVSIINLPMLQYNENAFLKLLLVNPRMDTLSIKLSQVELENRELTSAIVMTPPNALILRELPRLDDYTDDGYSINDEIETKLRQTDDEVFVIERRSNKLRIRLKVKPTIPAGEIKFVLRADIEFRDVKKTHNPFFYIFMNLGTVSVATKKSSLKLRQRFIK